MRRLQVGARWRTLRYWVREFLGENDYERYVRDWGERHQGVHGDRHRLLTPREFYLERCGVRYGEAVRRCC